MFIEVECEYCSGLNVVDVSYDLESSEFQTESITTFDEFYRKYAEFVRGLPEFPVKKGKLLKMIKTALNVNTALAYDILDRLKLDLGLYEKDGMIHSVDEYL